MNWGDIVTVEEPVEAASSKYGSNPEFVLVPGMVASVRHTPEPGFPQISLYVENGPANYIGSSTVNYWYVFTDINNVVPVTNKAGTCLLANLLDREQHGEAVRLMQKKLMNEHRKSILGKTEMRERRQVWDRWGRAWSSEEVQATMWQRIGNNFTIEVFNNASLSLWLTYKFTWTNPAKPEPTVRQNRRSKYCYVNVYHYDRYYKGPAEGGDWRNEEWCTESYRVKRKLAIALLREKERECREANEGAPSIYSVASRGLYSARMENFCGFDVTPPPYHYE